MSTACRIGLSGLFFCQIFFLLLILLVFVSWPLSVVSCRGAGNGEKYGGGHEGKLADKVEGENGQKSGRIGRGTEGKMKGRRGGREGRKDERGKDEGKTGVREDEGNTGKRKDGRMNEAG